METGIFDEKRERNNTVLLIIIAVATLLVAMVGATFAYFTATITKSGDTNSVKVQTATIGISYNHGTEVNVTGLMPGGTIADKTVTVTNTSGYPAVYSLRWVAGVTNTFTRQNELTYSVTCTGGTGTKNLTSTQLPATNASATTPIISTVNIANGETHTCVFAFNYANPDENQDADQGKSFTGNFEIVADPITTP